jgi:rubrerythrin
MSVSFIFNNLAFFYRIDSINRALPVIVWKCKDLPMVQGEAQSKEHMYEQIKSRLKQYYRNRVPVQTCDTCGLTSAKMEGQSTCPDCLIDNE